MTCPSKYHPSVLWWEILKGRNYVVWTRESVLVCFVLFVVGTAQVSAYTDSALQKQRAL